MGRKKITTIINEKIAPFFLTEKEKADISQLERQYPYQLLLECIDIGVASYFRYNQQGELLPDSVNDFLDKIGGIAFNKSLNPIDQEICHLKNKAKHKFSYCDMEKSDKLLREYIRELLLCGWSEKDVLSDLCGDSARMLNSSRDWFQWSDNMLQWIKAVKSWRNEDVVSIEQLGTILPDVLFDKLPSNIQSLCKQINASYENNLYDCAAVIMRRLLEGLLVLAYQKAGIESEIMSENGKHHITLDKIIKNAEQNKTLMLSANTKKDMALFKDLGNYSAHKIWYNCTQQDIKPHILKFRVIIEELLYKSELKL